MAALWLPMPRQRVFIVVLGSIRFSKLHLKINREPKRVSQVLKIFSHSIISRLALVCFQEFLGLYWIPYFLITFLLFRVWDSLRQPYLSIFFVRDFSQNIFYYGSIEVNEFICVHKEPPFHKFGHIKLVFQVWIDVIFAFL